MPPWSHQMRLYDELLSSPVQSNEQTTYRERTFFQRHLLAYTVSRLDQPFSAFRIDDDLDEEWRGKWATGGKPQDLQGFVPLEIPEDQLQAATWKHLPRLSGAALQLVEAADVIGARTHYDTDGMLLNTQQLRMAGLASLDVMQQVRRTLLLIADQMRIAPLLFGTDGPDGPDEQWQQQLEQALQERQGGQRTGRSRQSSSGGGRSPLDRSDLMTSWRHVFRVLVAWRQVSDAMEPIAWKAFAKGQRWPADMLYRTDTPIFTWVMGTARYLAVYPNTLPTHFHSLVFYCVAPTKSFPPAGSSTAVPLFLAPLLPFFPPSPSCTGQWISHGMAGPIAVSQRALDAEVTLSRLKSHPHPPVPPSFPPFASSLPSQGDEHRAPGPAAVTDGVSRQGDSDSTHKSPLPSRAPILLSLPFLVLITGQ
ncbi:unnamed protein product [Closterium sp. NIES-53]